MKKAMIVIICIIYLSFFGCNLFNGSEPANVAVYTKSSALENQVKNQSRGILTDDDWIFDERIITKVIGVRGVFTGICLRGDNSGQEDRFDKLGEWILFEGEETPFDLKEIQELITVENTSGAEGVLNVVCFMIKYLEMNLSFKGQESTIRIFWKHDESGTAQGGDILVKDPEDSNFKWVRFSDRTLQDQRPDNDDVVVINTFGILEGNNNLGSLVLDNFSNPDWLIDPPPWSEKEGEPGRLESYYTITSETVMNNLKITIDLSFENAATFQPYQNIGDPGNPDTEDYDTSEMPFYTIVYDGEGGVSDVQDLDGNSYTTAEFDILDILPAIQYPEVYVNVQIEEVLPE